MSHSSNDKGKKVEAACPGFSNRFNWFLNEAGYRDINQGRLTEFAEDMEMSLSGARKWVVEDNPPKGSRLIEVCGKVIEKKMPTKYNPKRVACWLEYGDEFVPNPFKSGKSIANDHAIMGSIYVLVHKMAKKLDINIYEIQSTIMDSVYTKIMDDVVENKLAEPDSRLISSLLVLANKESVRKKQGQ